MPAGGAPGEDAGGFDWWAAPEQRVAQQEEPTGTGLAAEPEPTAEPGLTGEVRLTVEAGLTAEVRVMVGPQSGPEGPVVEPMPVPVAEPVPTPVPAPRAELPLAAEPVPGTEPGPEPELRSEPGAEPQSWFEPVRKPGSVSGPGSESGAGPGSGAAPWRDTAAAVYRQVQAGEEFQEIRREYRSFVFPACVAFLAWYLLYIVAAVTLPEVMDRQVAGPFNIAWVLGLLQFASTFLIALLYARHARDRRDRTALGLRWETQDRLR